MTQPVDKTLTIAVAQLAGTENLEGNVARMQAAVQRAIDCTPRTELLVFPEGFLTGYYVADASQQAITASVAQAELQRLAGTHQIALAVGYIERDGARLHNAAMVVDETGALLAMYRKRCLYGDWEKRTFTAAHKPGVFDWRGWRIGICICYDIEFPEITRALAVAGAEIIITPTALMSPDHAPVFTLLPARAIENGVFIAYANRIGHERELHYVGGSCIINPRGETLAQATSGQETVLTATLNTSPQSPPSEYLRDLGAVLI